MNPFFFGDSSSPLWGVMDEPPAAVERGHGVLICPPIGHEYVRCHWALRQVASTLAKQGHHVLRFDWHGVGDSSGNMLQSTVARWCEDVHTASRELLDSTGVSSMSIVAVRLGAALAARAAKKIKTRAFVLWDPVVDGASYVNSLKRMHARMLVDDKRFWTLAVGKGPSTPQSELLGVEFSSALLADIADLTVSDFAHVSAGVWGIVSSTQEPPPAAYLSRLQGRDLSALQKVSTAQPGWEDVRRADELLLPGDAALAIASCLENTP